jgi:glutaconate CoA-transferase subunit A
VILPSFATSYVAVTPGGSHPSYAQGYSVRDNAFYAAWDRISRDRAMFTSWMRENVLRSEHAAGPR